MTTAPPPIAHITHWKAGSQWIHRILLACVADRVVPPSLGSGHFTCTIPYYNMVFPTVYLTKNQFDAVPQSEYCKKFIVIRDLRDTLISGYFSLLSSHAVIANSISDFRSKLSDMSIDDGLLYLLDTWLPLSASIQLSWFDSGVELLRFEELIENDLEILERVLLDDCELGISPAKLRDAILSCRFEELTGGRARGEEVRSDHLRKGISGDWRNYFSQNIKMAFKARYGGLLVATGYESSLDW